MLRRVRALVAVLAAVVVLAGCRADATVRVDLDQTGAGTVAVEVALDQQALALLGTNPLQQLQTGDLAAAGWTVDAPRTAGDRTVLGVHRAFSSPEEMQRALGQVFGPDGVLRDVRLDRSRRFGATTWTFSATIDPSRGPKSLGDPQVAALLGGQPLGRDIASLERQTGGSLADTTSLTFTLAMPGDVSTNGPTDTTSTSSWRATFANTPLSLQAIGTIRDPWPRRWLLLALGLAVVALLLAVRAFFGRRGDRGRLGRRPNGRRPGGSGRRAPTREEILAARAPQSRREAIAPAPHEPLAPPDEIEGVRVLRDGDPAAESLVESEPEPVPVPAPAPVTTVVLHENLLFAPEARLHEVVPSYAAEVGSTADRRTFRRVFDRLALGKLSTGEFWAELGASGDSWQLDAGLVDQVRLADDLAPVLARLLRRKVDVVVLCDGPAAWYEQLRRVLGLDAAIRTWVVSSELGVRPSDPELFRRLELVLRTPGRQCLYLDDDARRLDHAKAAGLRTALVRTGGRTSKGHRSFARLGDLAAH